MSQSHVVESTPLFDQHNILSQPDEAVVVDTEDKIAQLLAIGIGDTAWWDLPRTEKYQSLEAVIGDTVIETITLTDGSQVKTKRECDNPSGSHYDRAYLKTLQHFESIGFIRPGDELRDITSGSAGISLALLSNLLGYKARITVPSELPANRIYPMMYFGAEVFSSGKGYIPNSSKVQKAEIETFREDHLWRETRPIDRSGRSMLFSNDGRRICYLNHSENELSPEAFAKIADELATQAFDATHVVLAEGNWTTIKGIVPRLHELMPTAKIVGYSGEIDLDKQTENYGTNVSGVTIRFKDASLLDDEFIITNTERDTASVDATELGRSSHMGLAAARRILTGTARAKDAKVVTIAYDTAVRY